MRAARVVITAHTAGWARTAAQSMTGFATSVIGCKVEAGIEAELGVDDTPDGRPGISVLLFAFDAAGLGQRLVDRVGQSVLTCPTTACFDGLPDAAERVPVGGLLRHFGDRYQSSKFLDGRRYWRIPVMEGEFLVQESFGVQKAIGGGNFLILAADYVGHDRVFRHRHFPDFKMAVGPVAEYAICDAHTRRMSRHDPLMGSCVCHGK